MSRRNKGNHRKNLASEEGGGLCRGKKKKEEKVANIKFMVYLCSRKK
jgi:hypothetical protein